MQLRCKRMAPHAVLVDLEPMLATTGMPGGQLTGWAAKPKSDGWRARVLIENGAVRVRTRTGRVITEAVPELTCRAGAAIRIVALTFLAVGLFSGCAGSSGQSEAADDAVLQQRVEELEIQVTDLQARLDALQDYTLACLDDTTNFLESGLGQFDALLLDCRR